MDLVGVFGITVVLVRRVRAVFVLDDAGGVNVPAVGASDDMLLTVFLDAVLSSWPANLRSLRYLGRGGTAGFGLGPGGFGFAAGVGRAERSPPATAAAAAADDDDDDDASNRRRTSDDDNHKPDLRQSSDRRGTVRRGRRRRPRAGVLTSLNVDVRITRRYRGHFAPSLHTRSRRTLAGKRRS